MATWDAERLLTRVREVTESAAGTLRTITAGVFIGDMPPGLGTNEEARRALAVLSNGTKVPCEARVVRMRRSKASPPVIGNLALYDVEVEVRAVYPVATSVTLDDATRDSVSGLAAKHGDTLAQALGYPGNVSTTTAGQSTGVVSGLLSHDSSDYEWTGVAGAGGTLVGRHRFKCVVRSAPAT
jgi:hypothetical protein